MGFLMGAAPGDLYPYLYPYLQLPAAGIPMGYRVIGCTGMRVMRVATTMTLSHGGNSVVIVVIVVLSSAQGRG